MKAVRATLGILTLCALSACGEATTPLSPEQAAPRHDGGILTIGAGAMSRRRDPRVRYRPAAAGSGRLALGD